MLPGKEGGEGIIISGDSIREGCASILTVGIQPPSVPPMPGCIMRAGYFASCHWHNRVFHNGLPSWAGEGRHPRKRRYLDVKATERCSVFESVGTEKNLLHSALG